VNFTASENGALTSITLYDRNRSFAGHDQ